MRDATPFAANIPKYYAYVIFRGLNFGLFTAVWVIFLQERHAMTMTQVTLTDVAFWIASTLGEVPTGIVADTYGRKASLAIGVAIMCAGTLIWAFAPSVAAIVMCYTAIAIGATFLSGAEDALLFESLKHAGRASDYTRVAGQICAVSLSAAAVGNLASGLLASVDLRLPFIMGGLSLFAMLLIVISFREPRPEENSEEAEAKTRTTYGNILRQVAGILAEQPRVRYAMVYMTLVPIAAMALQTVFLQPQAIALGVPLAGIGAVVMAVQLSNVAGSAFSYRVRQRLGERRIIAFTPLIISFSLLLLGMVQQLPALAFAAAISFATAVMRPVVMSRIHHEVSDSIRATVLSMQSLLFAFIVVFVEPLMGAMADRYGLPFAYYGLAAGLLAAIVVLFWRSRHQFP